MERERRRSGAAAAAARAAFTTTNNIPAVLVVDDDPDARGIYAEYLRSKGWIVFTAADGRAAVEKAKELGPSIVVMDLAMPHVDGFEAIRRLRESSWTRRLPIIAMSAVPLSQDLAVLVGCDAYLAKPLAPETLFLQICSMLRLSSQSSPA